MRETAAFDLLLAGGFGGLWFGSGRLLVFLSRRLGTRRCLGSSGLLESLTLDILAWLLGLLESMSLGFFAASLLFENGLLDTLVLGDGDQRRVTLTNNKNVGDASSKSVTDGILQVNDFSGTRMLFTALNDTNATQIASASNHSQITIVKLDKVNNLVGVDVNLDGIIDLNQRIRVTNCATIVGDNEWNTLLTNLDLLDFAQFELGLIG